MSIKTSPPATWSKALLKAGFHYASKLAADVTLLRLAAINVLLFGCLGFLAPEHFLSTANFSSMAVQLTGFGIFALAMLTPMITGGIDLSVISLANLSAIIGAKVMLAVMASAQGLPGIEALAIVLGLSSAIACGVLGGIANGAIIALIGVSPILATLSTGLVFLGVALVLTSGSALTGLPDAFGLIGSGSVLSLPYPIIIFVGAAAILAFVLSKTALGTKAYLFGTNALASRFAGISNTEVTLKTYLLSGGLSALAGILIAARANSAKADYATSYLLLSILVCVLGGVNPLGGSGKVIGVVLAVTALQFLSSGLNILGVTNFATDFVWGGLLLAVMSMNQIGRATRG